MNRFMLHVCSFWFSAFTGFPILLGFGKYWSCFKMQSCVFGLLTKKGKVLPYSLPSIGPGADPGVQAVSPQVTWSHPPDGRLPLLFARPAVTFPAEERHCPSAGTRLYCLLTGTCLWAACPRLLPGSGPAEIRTRDLLGSWANALRLSHTGLLTIRLKFMYIWWIFEKVNSWISYAG